MPTSGDLPQPTQEVAQTPRQRVETSFKERQVTADALNHLSYEWTETRNTDDPKVYAEHMNKEKRLKQKLQDQNAKFMTEIVSNLPEAEEWERIERERLEATLRNKSYQARYGLTPTDKSHAKIAIAMGNRDYAEALENLKTVRERGSVSVSTTPK